jgi:hypothetical protein
MVSRMLPPRNAIMGAAMVRRLSVLVAAISIMLVTGGMPVQAVESADTTAPVVHDVGIAAGTRVNKTVVLQPVVSDDVAVTAVRLMVAEATAALDQAAPWSLSWNSRAINHRDVLVRVIAYDAAGNTSSASVSVYVDNYGPFLRFPWGFSDATPQSPNMSFTGVVPLDFRVQGVPADTARIEVSAGDTVIGAADAEPWTIPWDTSGYDGKITLTARSWDTAGNQGSAYSRVWADHTGPSLAVAFDFADGYLRAGGDVIVTAKDPAWVPSVELLVDGKVVSSANTDGTPLRLRWDRAAKNGRSTMTVRAYDTPGNVSTLTRTVIVDNDAPAVTVSPKANAKVRGLLAVTVTSTKDATGLAYLSTNLACTSYGITWKAPWTVKIDTRLCRDGKYTLPIDVRDKGGNQTLVKRSITVDNTKPAVKLSTAPKNKSKLRKKTKFAASASDANGVSRVELLVNGKSVAVDRKAGYSFTIDPKKYGKKFTVGLRAYDQAGNVAYSSKRTYRR